MSRTLRIVIGVVCAIAGLVWIGNGVQLIVDPNHELERWEMILASFATGLWLLEELFKVTKDD